MYIFLSDNRQQLKEFFIQQQKALLLDKKKKKLPLEHEHIRHVTNK